MTPRSRPSDSSWKPRTGRAIAALEALRKSHPHLDWDQPSSVFHPDALLEYCKECGEWGARFFRVHNPTFSKGRSRFRVFYCGRCNLCRHEKRLIYLHKLAIIAANLCRPVVVTVYELWDHADSVKENGFPPRFFLTDYGRRLADSAIKSEARRIRSSGFQPRPGGCSFAIATIETTVFRDRRRRLYLDGIKLVPGIGHTRPYLFAFSEVPRQRAKRSDAGSVLPVVVSLVLEPGQIVDYAYYLINRERETVHNPAVQEKKRSGKSKRECFWGPWKEWIEEVPAVGATDSPLVQVKGIKNCKWPWTELDKRLAESPFRAAMTELISACRRTSAQQLHQALLDRHRDWWDIWYQLADAWCLLAEKGHRKETRIEDFRILLRELELSRLPKDRRRCGKLQRHIRKIEKKVRTYARQCENVDRALSGQIADGIRSSRLALEGTPLAEQVAIGPDALPVPPGYPLGS